MSESSLVGLIYFGVFAICIIGIFAMFSWFVKVLVKKNEELLDRLIAFGDAQKYVNIHAIKKQMELHEKVLDNEVKNGTITPKDKENAETTDFGGEKIIE